MNAIRLAIAELLPTAYRGVYEEAGTFDDVFRMLHESRQIGPRRKHQEGKR